MNSTKPKGRQTVPEIRRLKQTLAARDLQVERLQAELETVTAECATLRAELAQAERIQAQQRPRQADADAVFQATDESVSLLDADGTLRARALELSLLYETSPDAIGVFDLNGNIRLMNAAAAATFGYPTSQAMLGRNALEFFMPEDRLAAAAVIQRVLECGQVRNARFRLLKQDGSAFWAEFSCARLADGAGNPNGIVAVTRDITARQATETALRESEEKYRSLVAALTEGIVMQNMAGEIIACNPAAEHILGLTPEQMMGRTSIDPRWQSVHGDGSLFSGETHPAMVTLRTGQAVREVTMGVHKPNGELTWIHINAEPLFHPDETTPYAVVTTFVDITARKQADEQIRASEEKYRLLFENMQEGFALNEIIQDAAGQAIDVRVLDANVAFEKHTGVPRTAMLGKTAREFMPHLDATLLSFFSRVLASDEPATFEYFVPEFNLHLRIRAFCSQQGRLATVFEDITANVQAQAALRESEASLRAMFNATDESVLLLDADHTLRMLNPVAAQRMGQPIETLLGQKMPDVLPPDVVAHRLPLIDRVIATGQAESFEDERSGRWMFNHVYPISDEQGRVVRLVVYSRDITEHRRMEQSLRRSEALLNATQQMAQVGGWEYYPDTGTFFWTQEMYRIHGVSPGIWPEGVDAYIQRSLECYDVADRSRIHAAFIQCVQQGLPYDFEVPFTSMDGQRKWIRTTARAEYENGRVVRVIGYLIETALQHANARLEMQVQELHALQAQLREQALRDPLTQLYNRRYLNETMPREIARALRLEQTIGVLMLDLDHFKHINDTYGHLVGDECLQMVARVVQVQLRASDIVCRYGGEEIVCLLFDMPRADVLVRAEQLRAAVAELFLRANDYAFVLTTSIGVATLPQDGVTMEAALNVADAALYRAKQDGRNCVRQAEN